MSMPARSTKRCQAKGVEIDSHAMGLLSAFAALNSAAICSRSEDRDNQEHNNSISS